MATSTAETITGRHATPADDGDVHVRYRQAARQTFRDDHRHPTNSARGATVTVVVVNGTKFHGGRASTDLGDGRGTTVTISDNQQTRARR
jgi:hypothetical protein